MHGGQLVGLIPVSDSFGVDLLVDHYKSALTQLQEENDESMRNLKKTPAEIALEFNNGDDFPDYTPRFDDVDQAGASQYSGLSANARRLVQERQGEYQDAGAVIPEADLAERRAHDQRELELHQKQLDIDKREKDLHVLIEQMAQKEAKLNKLVEKLSQKKDGSGR